MMDKWTDDGHMDVQTHEKLMLLLHTLTQKESEVASLVKFCLVV